MRNHHIYARCEIRLDESLEIQCIGKDEGLDVTSLPGLISLLSLHLSTPLTAIWYVAQSKTNSKKTLIRSSWQRVSFMETLVGRANLVALQNYLHAENIDSVELSVSAGCYLSGNKCSPLRNVLCFDTIQEGMFFGEKERRKWSGKQW